MSSFKRSLSVFTALVMMLMPVSGFYCNVAADDEQDEIIIDNEPDQSTAEYDLDSEEAYWHSMSSTYYYDQLDDNAKAYYDYLDEVCMYYLLSDEDIESTPVSYGDFGLDADNAYLTGLLFFFSCPQYFFINGDFYPSNGFTYINIYPDFCSGAKRAEARADLKTTMNTYITAANAFSLPEEKEYRVFDMMCKNMTKSDERTPFQSIYDAVQDTTYSGGYMSFFCAVMNACGIDCICMTSRWYGWNAVNLHGFWYYVDVYNAVRSSYIDYSFYNSNLTVEPCLEALFGNYIPEVKYDCLDAYDIHTSRYFTVNGKSYFIVNDNIENGLYATPVIESEDPLPSTVTYNSKTYTLIEPPKPYIPLDTDLLIDNYSFPDDVFRDHVERNIDVDGNGYLSVEERNAVTHFEYYGGDLCNLKGLEYFPNLSWLNINFSRNVSELDISKNTKLRVLSCCDTNISTIDISDSIYFSSKFKNNEFNKTLFVDAKCFELQAHIGEYAVQIITDDDVLFIFEGEIFDLKNDPDVLKIGGSEDLDPDTEPLPEVTEEERAFWKSLSSDYYYNQLSENEKKLYDRLDNACMDYLCSTTVNSSDNITASTSDLGLSFEEAETVAEIFRNANPQYFFLFSAYAGGDSGIGIMVYNKFSRARDRAEARDLVRSTIQEYLDATSCANMPEDKEQIIYEMMCEKISYVSNSPYNQSLYSAVLGKTVCAGYMLMFSALMNACGIECASVTNSYHGWNIVKLHGYWYYTDTTESLEPQYVSYSRYNQNLCFEDIDEYLIPYLPDVKYDSLESSIEHTSRYVTVSGITYFIVNDIDSTGRMVVPVSGSATSFPSTITYNGNEYSVVNSSLRGWQRSGDKWYYYNDSGLMTLGWYCSGGVWYYFDKSGAMVTEWRKVSDKWYYFESSGKMVTGWREISGKWYCFNSNGSMLTGWKQSGTNWYYLTSDGPMAVGWQQINNRWYYFETDGSMITGWRQSGGYWYFFSSEGSMVTGWQLSGGKWYYFNGNGAMVTGWQDIGGKWYYFESSGAMKTGWKAGSGYWYYLNSNGVMLTGWQEIDDSWYYFESTGEMKTGWLYSGGNWYYMDISGEMVTGSLEISGKTYIFNDSGVCTNP